MNEDERLFEVEKHANPISQSLKYLELKEQGFFNEDPIPLWQRLILSPIVIPLYALWLGWMLLERRR